MKPDLIEELTEILKHDQDDFTRQLLTRVMVEIVELRTEVKLLRQGENKSAIKGITI